MQGRDHESLSLLASLRNAPYASSLASSASASSQSVWSDASSQFSDESAHTQYSDSEQFDSLKRPALTDQPILFTSPWAKQPLPPQSDALPPQLRQNPRRTSTGPATRGGCPPALVRQTDRKVNFVDGLVDSATQIVETIWPLSSIVCRNELGTRPVLPLRTFIQETLRRSRTSYSTLQVALYYLILIKPHVPKHDFTMEQSDDSHSTRALQCGRRMFLAALILASKYLQDRNFSARAWSKISGLNTLEINQNELAFLIAVNWKLHIVDEVFQRWLDIVSKFSPPPPPPSSPGSSCPIYARKCQDWRRLVLKLNTQLDNVDGLAPTTPTSAKTTDFPVISVISPRATFDIPSSNPYGLGYDTQELTTTPKAPFFPAPLVLEPAPAAVHTPGRHAPALGLLPTPRLTPTTSGFNTPAVSATSYMLGKSSSAMSMAMGHAANANATYLLDRFSTSTTSSPLASFPTRRSSLANSVSTASSPESMVSDSSRTSRSSSISSASSLLCAAPKLGMPARLRSKPAVERLSLHTTIASVPEDYEHMMMTTSPDSYTGPVGKLGDLPLETPLARRERELEEMRDSDAARALAEMQRYTMSIDSVPAPKRPTLKRSRTSSVGNSSLQDNVRSMLGADLGSNGARVWPDALVRNRTGATNARVAIQTSADARKRLCCSTEMTESFQMPALHPAVGGAGGPGMWQGILH